MGHCAAERLCHGGNNVFLGSCAGQPMVINLYELHCIGANAGKNA